jgi:hypothetical protein
MAKVEPSPGGDLVTRGVKPCGGHVSGVFAEKSFVELRHDYSINGRPMESEALNLEQVGSPPFSPCGAPKPN